MNGKNQSGEDDVEFEYQVGDYVTVDFDEEGETILKGLVEGELVDVIERGGEEKCLVDTGVREKSFVVSRSSLVDPAPTF